MLLPDRADMRVPLALEGDLALRYGRSRPVVRPIAEPPRQQQEERDYVNGA